MKWKRMAFALTLLAAGGAWAEERSVRVRGDRSWTGTGIRVWTDDRLAFRASGDVGWGKGDVGPDGTSSASGGFFRPLGDRPLGGLIGRVGTSVFWIGREAEVRAPADGELELGINDDKVLDNSGEFRVEVRTGGGRGSRGSDSGSGYGSRGGADGGRSSGDWDRYRSYDRDRDRDRDRDWFWWRGKVDGVDQLVVRGETLRVEHLDKDPIQSQEHRFSAALPAREVDDLRLETREGRGTVRLLQRPGHANDWTAIVALDDSDGGGAAWYELLLSWERRRDPGGAGYDALFRWRGEVDIGCRIKVRGKTSSVEDRGGRGTQERFATFTAPLPESEAPVSLRKVDGRGRVRLVETPSRSNGYTAVVEIEDEKSGSDRYEFELSWGR